MSLEEELMKAGTIQIVNQCHLIHGQPGLLHSDWGDIINLLTTLDFEVILSYFIKAWMRTFTNLSQVVGFSTLLFQ